MWVNWFADIFLNTEKMGIKISGSISMVIWPMSLGSCLQFLVFSDGKFFFNRKN